MTLFVAKGYAACHQPVRHDDDADSCYAAFPFRVFVSRKTNSVRYNDWRQVHPPPSPAFAPTAGVSVIMPCYGTPVGILAKTLAALEKQTYPQDLFEIVIVDDGSEPPLACPPTPLAVRVVRQERRGFGLARARNTGAQAATHDILLFLDGDVLPEAGWMAAHAAWLHAVSDALTIGFRGYVATDDIDPETVRTRPGTLRELFADRPTDPPWIENHMIRSKDLTSRADDHFRTVEGGNFGIGREFYREVGGSDESFARWGMEDIELGYRAYVRGGLLVPVREAFAWHQGRWSEGRETRNRSLRMQHRKTAHLIAHTAFRRVRRGRSFTVPQHVVTITGADAVPTECLLSVVDNVLNDRIHDLVVRIETADGRGDGHLTAVREVFGPEPRIHPDTGTSALEEFPVSPFHVTLPAKVGGKNPVSRLRTALGSAVAVTSAMPDGTSISITRTWALHRARRAGGDPSDFGDAKTLSPARLGLSLVTVEDDVGANRSVEIATGIRLLFLWAGDIRGAGDAWRLLKSTIRKCLGK